MKKRTIKNSAKFKHQKVSRDVKEEGDTVSDELILGEIPISRVTLSVRFVFTFWRCSLIRTVNG
jgi:hypothetical protein